jgi:transcriptional regulator with XRE-family HTH domain
LDKRNAADRRTLAAVGEAVRRHRAERQMSQEDLALACGLDRTYIGGIERGERNVGVLNLARIARAIGISISDLLSDVR